MGRQGNYRMINGKEYYETGISYSRKKDAVEDAKEERKKRFITIIEKKDGFHFYARDKKK